MTDVPGPQDHDRLLGFTRGDATRARALREQLTVLRDHSEDPAFKKLMDRTISGEVGLREAARAEVFDREVTPQVQRFGRWWDELSEEEKEQLAEQGRATLAAERSNDAR